MQKKQLWICALSGAMAVVAGALGAHKLKYFLSDVEYSNWETAVQYHFIHGLALLVLALRTEGGKPLNLAFNLFAFGILCFSGSLYFFALKAHLGIENIGPLGLVTPLGGLFFIAGWIMLIFLRKGK